MAAQHPTTRNGMKRRAEKRLNEEAEFEVVEEAPAEEESPEEEPYIESKDKAETKKED